MLLFIKNFLWKIRSNTLRVLYYGKKRYCPVCNKQFRKFASVGYRKRRDAQCVYCGALERHRLLWLFLQRKMSFFKNNNVRVLHIAPERCFESKFQKIIGNGYITADLYNPRAMIKMDITSIQFPDRFFDVIFCSHVLEHIPDDRKAMRELYRVLKDDGWAILLVPITTTKTFEDISITDPKERIRLFGRPGHVRRYGPDYVDRLREAGFFVKKFGVSDVVSKEEAIKMGLAQYQEKIYYCTKTECTDA